MFLHLLFSWSATLGIEFWGTCDFSHFAFSDSTPIPLPSLSNISKIVFSSLLKTFTAYLCFLIRHLCEIIIYKELARFKHNKRSEAVLSVKQTPTRIVGSGQEIAIFGAKSNFWFVTLFPPLPLREGAVMRQDACQENVHFNQPNKWELQPSCWVVTHNAAVPRQAHKSQVTLSQRL